MRRTIIVIMMFYAMLNCIANVSVTQSMYLPPQNVVAEFMEIEDLSEGSRGEGWFWNFSTATITDNNARFLDILTGSFISRDALAGSYPHLSPYAHCANNPLIYIDPTGMEPCDPVENPQIRRNRASNLYGKDIRIYNGKLKSHQGFDYAAPVGTDVLSVKDGTVVEINTNHKDYGMSVTIEHKIEDEILYSFYAHLSEIKVEKGDAVKEGDIIGASGNTGNAGNMQGKDEHLHFELRTKKENAVGLIGKTNPNKIVDTKFVSEDPNAKYQNQKGVKKINYDGSIEIQKVDFTK